MEKYFVFVGGHKCTDNGNPEFTSDKADKLVSSLIINYGLPAVKELISLLTPVFSVETNTPVANFSEAEKNLLIEEDIIFHNGEKWFTDNEPLLWSTLSVLGHRIEK